MRFETPVRSVGAASTEQRGGELCSYAAWPREPVAAAAAAAAVLHTATKTKLTLPSFVLIAVRQRDYVATSPPECVGVCGYAGVLGYENTTPLSGRLRGQGYLGGGGGNQTRALYELILPVKTYATI